MTAHRTGPAGVRFKPWPVWCALFLGACGAGQLPAPHGPLAPLELRYQTLRYWDDQQRLFSSLGRDPGPAGDSLAVARAAFAASLNQSQSLSLDSADTRARASMVRAWESGLAGASESPATTDSLARYTSEIYTVYGRAAEHIVVDGDTLNRLAILGKLGREPDSLTRRRLFLALGPVWQSVNRDDGADSPYRTLLRLRHAAWGDTASPIEQKAPAFGLTTATMERWLTEALAAWHRSLPDTLREPWDWYYFAGQASRELDPTLPDVASLRRVNQAFYASIGAPPEALHIQYDLLPRPGKDPVAFTDFGSHGRWEHGAWLPTTPWVFTAYLGGGLDNLGELLHETGHGIHIAAIRTRPAYLDWPDNDTFTEALADLAALEITEPRWQRRFLGRAAPLDASLRARYAGIMMDMAWALFEIRMHRDPGQDPNRLWTDITRDYLGIRPHPELSWWAMRGQLIDAPGYLINYALGAFITADLRATATGRGHPIQAGGPGLYRWLSTKLYRYGLEVSSRVVLERFLGRPLSAESLLADLGRMGCAPGPAPPRCPPASRRE